MIYCNLFECFGKKYNFLENFRIQISYYKKYSIAPTTTSFTLDLLKLKN